MSSLSPLCHAPVIERFRFGLTWLVRINWTADDEQVVSRIGWCAASRQSRLARAYRRNPDLLDGGVRSSHEDLRAFAGSKQCRLQREHARKR